MFPSLSSKLSSTLSRTSALLGLAAATCLSAQTFTNPYRIPTSVDPVSVVVGDINGDGLPDILWAEGPVLPAPTSAPAVLHVLLAQPIGGFMPGTSLSLPAYSTGECLLVDFNHDHHLDLVCTNTYQFNDSLQVFLGNGDGTFQAPITTPINNFNDTNGAWTFPIIASVGDLNGDGFPDLIEEDVQSQQTQVLLGDGTGGFKPGIPIQGGINGVLPVAADVNGDGFPDLLFPVGPTVELGKGDGTFGPMTNYAASSYYDATCVFHDMDGDGHLDAVCGYAESSGGDITGGTDLIVLHGNPDGSFNTTPISDKTFGDQNNEFDGFGTFLTPTYVGDVNGDGIPDVLGNSGDGLAAILGGHGLTFSTPLHYAQAVVGNGDGQIFAIYQSQFADMNGDGVLDIVAAGPNGIYITYGQKNGSFASAFAPEVAEFIGYPTVADFNGDGIPDIAATGDTTIKLSLGNGDGTFGTPTALPNNNGAVNFSTPLWATDAHILHGDFNGDGKLDLLAIGSPSIYQYNSYILFGHGNGTFNAPVLVPNSSSDYPMYEQLTDFAVFDINHDGRSDLLSSTANITTPAGNIAQISFALSKGDGSFTNVSTTVPTDMQGIYVYLTFPALADFNHDGKLDAVYGSITNAYVVNGHGDGTFDTTSTALPIPEISGQPSQDTLAVTTGDFDGDGNQDFAVLVQYGNGTFPYPSPIATAAWVFYGNGNGTFSAPVLAGTFDRNYTGITAASLTNGGSPDLILQTSGSLGGGYAIGIVNSQTGRTFGPEINYTAGTGLSSLAVIDVNNDGLPDLVFGNGDYNVRASSVTVLLNKGSGGGGSGGSSGDPSTTTALTCNPSVLSVNDTSLFSATVSSASGTPTGSVIFTDNGTALSQPTLTNGIASYTLTARQSGTRTIIATYVPTGSFAASSASCVLTVSGYTTIAALSVTPTLASQGTPITLTANVSGGPPGFRGSPTGSITFYNGTTVIDASAHLTAGTASFTTTTLPPGIDYLTCTYAGNATFAPSTCNTVAVIITQTSSVITLASSVNPALALTPITFTAQIAPGSSGTIVFNVNGQNITTTPNAAGTSTYTTSSLARGSYLITASYFATPDSLTGQASLIQDVNLPVVPADFSLTGTDITIQINHKATGRLLLASLGSFAGSVALTCNPPYPPGYTCKLQTSNVTLPAGFSTYVTYTLSPTYSASSQPIARSTRVALAVLFPLSFFGLIGLARKRRTTIRTFLCLVVLTTLASITTACGPDHFIPLIKGTYPITFTGVGTSQNDPTPITHTVTVDATVAP
jgi:hypothetical protein